MKELSNFLKPVCFLIVFDVLFRYIFNIFYKDSPFILAILVLIAIIITLWIHAVKSLFSVNPFIGSLLIFLSNLLSAILVKYRYLQSDSLIHIAIVSYVIIAGYYDLDKWYKIWEENGYFKANPLMLLLNL